MMVLEGVKGRHIFTILFENFLNTREMLLKCYRKVR